MARFATGISMSLSELGEDWYATFRKMIQPDGRHVLLESGRGGRYSIMGLSPFATLTGKDERLHIDCHGKHETRTGPLLASLRSWMADWQIEADPVLPDIQGGLIGQISYDLIREVETIPTEAADDLDTRDVELLAFDELYVVDHRAERLYAIAVSKDRDDTSRAAGLLRDWQRHANAGESFTFSEKKDVLKSEDTPVRSLDEEAFSQAVEQVQTYIRQGDVFQVNLSVRETRALKTPPEHLYDKLREINPSPYMGYLSLGDVTYVSASPELLVKIRGDEISTRPIAGTRSRGKSPEDDDRLARTLLENEKERAEHIMLVDLERNDLGRVSAFGTVEVDELMVIEKYSHVQHIVSNVKGQIRDDCDAFDVIAATFPGGTITGAPKIRTMEIIEELEPVRRGAYTGSMGWIGFQGDMELNITIRTMVIRDGDVHVQAGAGIVIDSDPSAEFKECLKKAKALWHAKEQSEAEWSGQ
ncbi:anthranilate synthase component I family protein [Salisediminibacterium selenitireducens]|uniref:Anthranilate synthase n=1 Tax=Bacillus selenitireducens (strain ATCC 700615 / DSM 15326 / MLS10) TaxID=439292 RepID=D6XV62_BACIE|nr:anthranilate synthase component I family protein [Salisediminibacterium selenitireducens]ADH97620.1 Anthranilate synthase [[Bacillus] selenitireducens MLS10]